MSERGEKKGHDDKREFGTLAAAGTRALAARLFLVWLAVSLAVSTVFMGRIAWDDTVSLRELVPLGVFTAAVVLEFALLAGKTLSSSARLFEIVTFLVGIGMAMQFRMGAYAGSSLGVKFALPAGFASMLLMFAVFRRGRWRFFEKMAPLCYVVALGALGAMLVFGRRFRGGLYLPGNVNPTEFVKPLLAVALAALLAKNDDGLRRSLLGLPFPKVMPLVKLLALWLPAMALTLAVRDLGLALLLNALLAFMLVAATRRPGWLLWFAASAAAIGWLAWKAPGHVHARIAAWLNPFADPTGSGWQLLQGFSAMFAGGLWGSGLGAGLPIEVPIVATDFAYAAIAEELGMILSLLILALYAALAVRGFINAGRPQGKFGPALASGLSAVLALQALLNLGGVVKALPLTGVVLPFISQGGSGLIAMMATAGLLAAVESD